MISGCSISEALKSAEQELTFSSSARLDAEVLMQNVLRCERSYLFAHAEQILSDDQNKTFKTMLQERICGKPIAYITGNQSFWDMDLHVSTSTLVPRPDTESIIEYALSKIPNDVEWNIADLGTGTGAIALVIARERPHCQVLACDINQDTLAVAKRNLEKYKCSNLKFITSDWLSSIQHLKFNMIISNPPYIEENDPHLEGPGIKFEPIVALVSGLDGLDAIRKIIQQSLDSLTANGFLILEHGYNQGMEINELLKQHDYYDIEAIHDLNDHHRGTSAQYS